MTPTKGYVAFSTSDDARSFDLATSAVGPSVSLLPLGTYPYDATYEPNGKRVWIAAGTGDGVLVVDPDTEAVVASISVAAADYTVDITFNPSGTIAFLSGRDGEAVVPVNTQTLTPGTPISLPGDGGGMAYNPCNDKLYVAEWFSTDVFVVDPVTNNVTSHVIGEDLWDLVVSPDGKTLYINDRGPDALRVVDVATMTVTTGVPTCTDPWGIDMTPDGKTIIVTCEDAHAISFVDVATLTATPLALPNDSDPRDVEIDATGTKAYVTSGDLVAANTDAIYVIDIATKSLVDTIVFPGSSNANVVAVAPAPTVCVP